MGSNQVTFWWHNLTTVGNIKKLFHADGIKAESQFHLTAVHSFFQFTQSPDPTYKINPVIGSCILNTKDRGKNIFLQNTYVQDSDRIIWKTIFLASS